MMVNVAIGRNVVIVQIAENVVENAGNVVIVQVEKTS